MRCPQPILKITVKSPDMTPGDILEVLGDCPTFEKDVRVWCEYRHSCYTCRISTQPLKRMSGFGARG
ncbi:MAG: sulfurtransferase TusA family protein [bacterium]